MEGAVIWAVLGLVALLLGVGVWVAVRGNDAEAAKRERDAALRRAEEAERKLEVLARFNRTWTAWAADARARSVADAESLHRLLQRAPGAGDPAVPPEFPGAATGESG